MKVLTAPPPHDWATLEGNAVCTGCAFKCGVGDEHATRKFPGEEMDYDMYIHIGVADPELPRLSILPSQKFWLPS
jgi:hypothetical protein